MNELEQLEEKNERLGEGGNLYTGKQRQGLVIYPVASEHGLLHLSHAHNLIMIVAWI